MGLPCNLIRKSPILKGTKQLTFREKIASKGKKDYFCIGAELYGKQANGACRAYQCGGELEFPDFIS